MCFLKNICVMDSLDGVRSSSHLCGFHEEEMTPSGGCGGFQPSMDGVVGALKLKTVRVVVSSGLL